jgi:GNAT superfamily N-acetyltransferase
MTPEIIDYEDRYASIFKSLNAEWLDKYNLMEDADRVVLDHPRKNIIDHGGAIYLARIDDQVIGTAALLKEPDNIYELAKMTVDPAFRSLGISKLLIEKCLDKARALRARKVILFSNHQLKAALGLYEKYGFRYIPVKDSPFLTADIKMELSLD